MRKPRCFVCTEPAKWIWAPYYEGPDFDVCNEHKKMINKKRTTGDWERLDWLERIS